jgi:hypothetical protein
MIPAERHRKILLDGAPPDRAALSRDEDLLTSHVFGLLRYLPHEQGLSRLFERLGLQVTPPVRMMFWVLDGGTEPDVLLDNDELLVLVEAKLYAGFGDNQLGREWIYLTRRAMGRRRLVVPLTPYVVSREEILGIIKEDLVRLDVGIAPPSEAEIEPLTWSDLGQAILAERGFVEPHVQAILDDLRFVLESRGVLARPFEGWPPALQSLPPCPAWYGEDWFDLDVPTADLREAWRQQAPFYEVGGG